jgi:mannan endo-1,4-beta-mannosidase
MVGGRLVLLALLAACTGPNPAFRPDFAPDADAPTLPPDAAHPVDAPADDAAAADAAPPADVPLSLNPDLPPPPPDLANDLSPADTNPATGLTGFYFADNMLGSLVFQRVDPILDFAWANDPPDPRMPFLGFSVRWTGRLRALYTETYTFTIHSGDGARLWIDGVIVIDNWRNQAPSDVAQSTPITSGIHDLKLEYLHNTGWSVVRLFWESAHQAKAVVPSEFLLPN